MTPSDETAMTLQRPVILLTGMSGAGLSTALKVFEDIGYEAVDNLRLGLVPELVEVSKDAKALAIAIDTRNANFSIETILQVYKQLGTMPHVRPHILFLECSDEPLQRRFTETRRRHPLALDRPVTDGIRSERELLWRLKNESSHVLDTSILSVHELRRIIAGQYRLNTESGLTVFVSSFSFKQGIPREADLLFDVRFLANPYWEPSLRALTGQDEEIANYIKKDKDYQSFVDHLAALLVPLLPRYQMEGKSYLTIAIGCTGGRHRSVFIAEQIATILAGSGYIVGIAHRDLDRAPGKQ